MRKITKKVRQRELISILSNPIKFEKYYDKKVLKQQTEEIIQVSNIDDKML